MAPRHNVETRSPALGERMRGYPSWDFGLGAGGADMMVTLGSGMTETMLQGLLVLKETVGEVTVCDVVLYVCFYVCISHTNHGVVSGVHLLCTLSIPYWTHLHNPNSSPYQRSAVRSGGCPRSGDTGASHNGEESNCYPCLFTRKRSSLRLLAILYPFPCTTTTAYSAEGDTFLSPTIEKTSHQSLVHGPLARGVMHTTGPTRQDRSLVSTHR